MKITKYTHSCMMVEDGGKRLIIDPSGLGDLPENIGNISVLVVSHIHPDHFNLENIARIVTANPDITIVANSEVMQTIDTLQASREEITEDCTKSIGGFELELFVGDHAIVYQQVPCQNLRLSVNNRLYYPGDTYVPLGKKIAAVAVPLNAPWAKVSEAIEFALTSEADIFFPVHDGILTETGHGFYNGWLTRTLEADSKNYQILATKESLEV